MADSVSSTGRRLPSPVWVLLAALMLAGNAFAADLPSADTREQKRPKTGLRLYGERLAPRVSIEMESLASFDHAAGPGHRLHDHVLFEEMSASVRRGAERVTRRAVKKYLIDSIDLDRGVDSLRSGLRGPRTASRAMRFDFGIHSASPQVGVTTRLGQGSLRFRVGAEGDLALRFRNNRFERAEVSAVFDGDDTVSIRANLGF